jgi:hypothetical protein
VSKAVRFESTASSTALPSPSRTADPGQGRGASLAPPLCDAPAILGQEAWMATKSVYELRLEDLLRREKGNIDYLLGRVQFALKEFDEQHRRFAREVTGLVAMRDDVEVLAGKQGHVYHRLEGHCSHRPIEQAIRLLVGEARRRGLRECSFCWR